MNKILGITVLVLFVAGIFSSSCKRGVSIGTVGTPMEGDFPHFDTFDFPIADYYFYGKFDGRFIKWQAGYRSKWDTITRLDPNDPDKPNWPDWPKYNDNIYRNIPQSNANLPCINDSDNVWFEHRTRFLRPEIPDMRMEILFYDCIENYDTILAFPPFNPQIITHLDFHLGEEGEIAQPFSNTQFGRRGVKLVYTDANRDRWETREGSGQLIDTYFRITDLYPRDVTQDTLDTLAMYIVEGEFAGRLYNGNKEIPVTEAKFRARLVPRIVE